MPISLAAAALVADEKEDGNAAQGPSDNHGFGIEKKGLNGFCQNQSDNHCRKETQQQIAYQTESCRVFAADALPHLAHSEEIQIQHSQDSAYLDADRVSIQCLGLLQPQQILGDDKVTGGADGQILGEAFNKAKDNGLQDGHCACSCTLF